MKFAFLIFKYFPYGGVQRDMLRIANSLANLGHAVDIYCMSWEGETPTNNVTCKLICADGFMNHKRYASFVGRVQKQIKLGGYDLLVGFNRMPSLDVYFAADPCYAERVQNQRGFLYRLSGRYRWFSKSERAVFAPEVNCEIILLSEKEKADFQRWYGTQDQRFHLLPPFLSAERMSLKDREEMRLRLRKVFGFDTDDKVLLLVGSGFRTKGLDRAIEALASLPPNIRNQTRLLAVGQDNPKQYYRLAAEMGLAGNIHISPGRDDIPQLMQGADLLIHPARNELAGHVLLEAMASALPILTADVCGYAFHVQKAEAGLILHSPFNQEALNKGLYEMLISPEHENWRSRGIQYANKIIAENQGNAEAEILIKMAQTKRLIHDALL